MDDRTIKLRGGNEFGVQRRPGDPWVYIWHHFADEPFPHGRPITPGMAREVACALLEAADEAESVGVAGGARIEQFGEQMRNARSFREGLGDAA